VAVSHDGVVLAEDDGYALAFDPTEVCWRLARQTGGAFSALRRSYSHTDGPVSVAISRNTTDFIKIWIQNDLVMTDQDSIHASSDYFYVECEPGTWIDNIVVEDIPRGNGSQIIISIEAIAFAIIGVAVIILIVGLVLLLRPKKVEP
jgi:hypothetical protein